MSQAATYASCPAQFAWAKSGGLDPCQMASSLIHVCDTNALPLTTIHAGQHYVAPTVQEQNLCACSSAVYSLISACSLCQDASIYTWHDWTRNCQQSFSPGFPYAQAAVTIPSWAKFDTLKFNTFDLARASSEAVAASPTATSTLISTVPLVTGFTSSISSVPSQPTYISSVIGLATSTPASQSQPVTSTVSPSSTRGPDSIMKQPPTQADHGTDSTQTFSSDAPHSSSTGSSTQSTNSEDVETKQSNAGAIAGGVIGGLALFAIVGGVIFWWVRRCQRSRMAPSAAYIAAYGAPRTSMGHVPFQENLSPTFPDEKARMRSNVNPAYTSIPTSP